MSEHSACPFCGGVVDPTGWLRGDGLRGPECEDCGATARSIEAWESRAEAQALREEVAALRRFAGEIYQVLGALDAPENVLDNASDAASGDKLRHETLLPFAALRARVVVLPSVDSVMNIVMRYQWNEKTNVTGTTNWAANLGMKVVDEVKRLNGKAVSEGLLREVSRIPVDGEKLTPERFRAVIDLNRELLGEGKEHE